MAASVVRKETMIRRKERRGEKEYGGSQAVMRERMWASEGAEKISGSRRFFRVILVDVVPREERTYRN